MFTKQIHLKEFMLNVYKANTPQRVHVECLQSSSVVTVSVVLHVYTQSSEHVETQCNQMLYNAVEGNYLVGIHFLLREV